MKAYKITFAVLFAFVAGITVEYLFRVQFNIWAFISLLVDIALLTALIFSSTKEENGIPKQGDNPKG